MTEHATKPARIIQALRLLCASSLLLTLAGCAVAPTTAPPTSTASQTLKAQHLQNLASIRQFTLQGRIGVQTNSKGFSGSLQWRHNSQDDEIALYSPIGSQVASISKTPDQVTLIDSSGKIYAAVDAETLTQDTLGWKLPLAGLADWSIGRPTASPVQNSVWNEQGLLTNLDQDGWKIEYSNYEQQGNYVLPGKIYLKSDKLNLKLLVEKWHQLGP